jgi:hypothetical protein
VSTYCGRKVTLLPSRAPHASLFVSAASGGRIKQALTISYTAVRKFLGKRCVDFSQTPKSVIISDDIS